MNKYFYTGLFLALTLSVNGLLTFRMLTSTAAVYGWSYLIISLIVGWLTGIAALLAFLQGARDEEKEAISKLTVQP